MAPWRAPRPPAGKMWNFFLGMHTLVFLDIRQVEIAARSRMAAFDKKPRFAREQEWGDDYWDVVRLRARKGL